MNESDIAAAIDLLSRVGEHLRHGVQHDYDQETGQQSYRSAWDMEADSLVHEVIQALGEFRPSRVCNACDWTGPHSDTCMLGEVGPLCPECRETTEEASTKAMP